jgi:hypothetical protein
MAMDPETVDPASVAEDLMMTSATPSLPMKHRMRASRGQVLIQHMSEKLARVRAEVMSPPQGHTPLEKRILWALDGAPGDEESRDKLDAILGDLYARRRKILYDKYTSGEWDKEALAKLEAHIDEIQMDEMKPAFERMEKLADAMSKANDIVEGEAVKQLRNVMLLAQRMKRRAEKNDDDAMGDNATHLLRFCELAGVKPSILREREEEEAADADGD